MLIAASGNRAEQFETGVKTEALRQAAAAHALDLQDLRGLRGLAV